MEGRNFSNLFNRLDIWEEFIFHLEYIKNNSSNEVLNIPDFDTSRRNISSFTKFIQS